MEPFSRSDHLTWESSRRRRSDIDFDDVFGGPPRRSSLSSWRSAEECADALSSSGRDADDACGGPWRSSFREKPVFGQVHSPSSRRKGPGDGFFSDIFRGGASGGSTPRRLDWDAQSSTQGSTACSPARTLPPRHEPVGGGSSLLSPPSVTQKFEKAQGYPASGSQDHYPSKAEDGASHAGIHMPSIVNGVSASQADMRTAPHHSLHLSDFLFQKFHGEDPSRQTDDSAGISSERNVDEDLTNLKDTKASDHFHFSIYQWASKGVMLMVPPSPKEKTKNTGRLSGLPVPFLHGVDHDLNKKSLPSGDRVFPSEFKRLDTEVHGGRKSAAELTEAINRTKVQTTDAIRLPSDEIAEAGMPVVARLVASGTEANKGTPSNDASDAPHITEKEEIPTSYKLFDLLKDHIGGKDGKSEDKIEGSLHQTASVGSADNVGERKQTVKMSTIGESGAEDRQMGYKMPSDRAQGKVKDFIQIFNQDVSSKFTNFVEPRSRSNKAKDMEECTMVYDERSYVNRLEGEENLTSSTKDEILPNEPRIKEFVKEKKLAFDSSASVQRVRRYSSVKNEATIPSVEFNLENVEVLNGKMEEPYFEVEECMVEEVVFQLQDQGVLPQTASKVEEFQNSDAKIRDWSAGKEGNIRSLLSTLQYVLWPGSGWKVVPLVDLIESSSVRKAYQRALLCLHPDKLQQRGAPEHQKYIAEKVFDILQEAWNQFSSVGPI